jgi:dolichol-phosphate mannosyltransferase
MGQHASRLGRFLPCYTGPYMTQENGSQRIAASLILPVYNHEERLTEVLDDIRDTLSDRNYEIIVVYDVTKPEMLDSVKAEQKRLQKEYGVRPVTRLNQRGFGSALRYGFEASRGDVVIPIMADRSDDIGAIPRMLERIEAGADIVGGCRYMDGGGIIGDTPKQRLSRLYSFLMGTISSVQARDVSNGFKAFRREVWEQVQNDSPWFDMSVEMTVKAAELGYSIDQVPTVWTNRSEGQSQFSMLAEFPRYSRWLLYAARRVPSRSFIFGLTLGAGSALLASGMLSVLARGGNSKSTAS